MPRKVKIGSENSRLDLTIYFVQCSQSDRTDRHMVQAFSTCEKASLKPEWIKEDDVENLSIKSTTVFVIREFKGSTFNYLSSKECLVCGPRCIHSCVSQEMPVPANKSPVFTTPMRGLVITSTRVPKLKKEEIKKMVGYMGGSYSDSLTMAVTHLLTDEGGSTKCEEAAEINIPIMKTSWVSAVWGEALIREVSATDEMFDKHRWPPFHKLEITCSNLSRDVKLEMKKLIESNGGTCTGKLIQNRTSVVVIGEPEGDKYKHAQMWNIPCLYPTWIYESVKKGVLLPKKEYVVKPKPTCSTPTKSLELASFMNSSEISVVRPAETTRSEVNDTVSSVSSCGSIKQSYPAKKTENRNLEYKKLLELVNFSEVASAGLFLDGCRVYLSGFTNQEVEKVKKMLNSGGATILMLISDLVSHVVVGNFVGQDALAIAQLQPRPHVVSFEWILESIRLKSPANVQPYLCLTNNGNASGPPPPSPLSHKGLELLKSNTSKDEEETPNRALPVSRKLFVKARKLNSSTAVEKNETLSTAEKEFGTFEKRSSSKQPEMPEEEEEKSDELSKRNSGNVQGKPNQNENSVQNRNEKPQSDDQTLKSDETAGFDTLECGFYAGLVFELVNLPEPEPAVKTVTNAGGTVINEWDHAIPDYAVVPFEGTLSRVTAPQVVTLLWIEDCFASNKVVDVMYYHRPLNLKVDQTPMLGTAICISGYVGRERVFIAHAASILGASVQELFSRRDHPNKGILKATHLVCNEPTGNKYTAAIKWGIPVVTKSWVLECAATGVLQPVDQFLLGSGNITIETPKEGSGRSSEQTGNTRGVIEPTPASGDKIHKDTTQGGYMGPPPAKRAANLAESFTDVGTGTPSLGDGGVKRSTQGGRDEEVSFTAGTSSRPDTSLGNGLHGRAEVPDSGGFTDSEGTPSEGAPYSKPRRHQPGANFEGNELSLTPGNLTKRGHGEEEMGRRHSDITPTPGSKMTPELRARSLDCPRTRNNGLVIIKRKLTPSSKCSQLSQCSFEEDDDDDVDDIELEFGTKSKQQKLNPPSSRNNFGTPPAIINKRLSTISPMMSPFHMETPDSPYGQVFTPNPSPGTKKKWQNYMDNVIDVNCPTGTPIPNERRLSTPCSVIKKQILVKFAGAEIEGIEPETGELLPNGPYKQWSKRTELGCSNISNLSTEPVNYGTPESKPESKSDGFSSEPSKELIGPTDDSSKNSGSTEKVNPRVLALKSDDNVTPLSHKNNTKKFVKKGDQLSTKPDEYLDSKLHTPQGTSCAVVERKSLELMEKYRNYESNNEITDEMRKRLANRLKPTTEELDDADNPLKEISGFKNKDLEGSVTWDIERPLYLEKMMEKEIAKKAEQANHLAKEEQNKSTENRQSNQEKNVLENITCTEETKNETFENIGSSNTNEPTRIFILSSVKQESRDKYEGIIKNLGGEVYTSAFFDSKITHIVIDKPARNEKMLCGIASGKWVLHISYLDQCYESRQFLPEDDYEWGSPRSLSRLPTLGAGSQEAMLSKAAYRWRHKVSQLGQRALPFRQMKAVLLTPSNKVPQLTRLLQAGGAILLTQDKLLEATHCFVDVGKVEIPVDIKELARKGIHCLPPVYLAEFLMRIPSPQPQDYWIDEYKKARTSLRL